MQIRRDYQEPFFREPKRHRLRNTLIAALLGILLGLVIRWQWTALEQSVASLIGAGATATPQARQLAARAALLAQRGDFDGSDMLWATALWQRPDNIAYLYEHGRTLIELGRGEEAYELAQRIVDLDARDPRGFALKAAALVWQGEAAVAVPIGLSGLELDRGFPPLYASLSRAYIDTQRWAEGLDMAERGLALNPDDAELIRAYAYALQSVGAHDQAAQNLERAIELRPSYLPPQFELAALFLSRDQDQRAIELYDRILALESRNARALLRQCLAYRKIGQFARALGYCEDAAANDQQNAEALFHLALLYYRERRFDQARDIFQACVDHDRGAFDLSCRYRLGLSHFYTGDCLTGWALLQESLKIAQAKAGYDETISRIQLGLDAIRSDPACVEAAASTAPLQD